MQSYCLVPAINTSLSKRYNAAMMCLQMLVNLVEEQTKGHECH